MFRTSGTTGKNKQLQARKRLPSRIDPQWKPFYALYERVCKPGSVLSSHLSRRIVAGAFQPPPRDGRAGLLSLRGVAPDRVYSIELSPVDE